MPKKKTYGFRDKEVAEQLKQMISGSLTSFSEGSGKSGFYIAQTPSGGIAARSGTTISSAACTLFSGEGGTLASATITVPVFNLSTSAVAGSAYIVAVMAGGVLVAVWEDC